MLDDRATPYNKFYELLPLLFGVVEPPTPPREPHTPTNDSQYPRIFCTLASCALSILGVNVGFLVVGKAVVIVVGVPAFPFVSFLRAATLFRASAFSFLRFSGVALGRSGGKLTWKAEWATTATICTPFWPHFRSRCNNYYFLVDFAADVVVVLAFFSRSLALSPSLACTFAPFGVAPSRLHSRPFGWRTRMAHAFAVSRGCVCVSVGCGSAFADCLCVCVPVMLLQQLWLQQQQRTGEGVVEVGSKGVSLSGI